MESPRSNSIFFLWDHNLNCTPKILIIKCVLFKWLSVWTLAMKWRCSVSGRIRPGEGMLIGLKILCLHNEYVLKIDGVLNEGICSNGASLQELNSCLQICSVYSFHSFWLQCSRTWSMKCEKRFNNIFKIFEPENIFHI